MMLPAGSSTATNCSSRSHDQAFSQNDIPHSDSDSHPTELNHCERMNLIWEKSCRSYKIVIAVISYIMFLSVALYSIWLEEYVKNDLVSALGSHTHMALRCRALGLMEKFEWFELQAECAHLNEQAKAVLQQEHSDEQSKEYDIENAVALYEESSYYINLTKRLQNIREKLSVKLNDTDHELKEITTNLTKEEDLETSLLNEIENITSTYENSWFCSNAPNFCEWIDGVVNLRRQADDEAAIVLRDLALSKNLSQEEAIEIFLLGKNEELEERYESFASTFYAAAQQYEIEAQELAIAIEFENVTYLSLTDTINKTAAREERMTIYFHDNINKSIAFFDEAEVDKQSVHQYSQYAIALAVICLLYFSERLITRTIIPWIAIWFEFDMIDDGRPVIVVGGRHQEPWNVRMISSCVQHTLIYMVTVGFLRITYNDLINNPRAAQTVVSFVFLASMIQTVSLHFLPHLLMESLPSLILYQQQDNYEPVNSLPIPQILKYSVMRFSLLFGLFTLEFLVAWLFAPKYVFSSSASIIWNSWYFRLVVICSILVHVLLFEKILEDSSVSSASHLGDHSTVCSVGSDDDQTTLSDNDHIIAGPVSSTATLEGSTEATPLVRCISQYSDNPDSVGGNDCVSKGATEHWPSMYLRNTTNGFRPRLATSVHLQQAGAILNKPFYVDFQDDLAKLLIASDTFFVASSVFIIRNCFAILMLIDSETGLVSSSLKIGMIVTWTLLSMLVIIISTRIVTFLISFWFYEDIERGDNGVSKAKSIN